MAYNKPNIRESELKVLMSLVNERDEIMSRLVKFEIILSKVVDLANERINLSWSRIEAGKPISVDSHIGLGELTYVVKALKDRITYINDKMTANGVDLGM